MKILGLDLGSKTVGIAISDALGFTAQGIETYQFLNEDYTVAANYIVNIIKTHNIKTVVLGYPKNMNGSIGERAQIVEEFKSILKQLIDIEVVLWDERLTTMQVQRLLIDADVSRSKRKKVVDKMAAVIILQSYLDFRK